MTETYIRLRCNAPPDTVELDPDHLLEGFYQSLDCECIETVRLDRGYLLVIDESGKLKDRSLNFIASMLVRSSDWIAGDAIIARMGTRDGETDIVPLGRNATAITLEQAITIWNRNQRRMQRKKEGSEND